MNDPVKEAVERLTDDLSRAREDGLVLTDAPNLRAVLAENARLVKLVEEAGEALGAMIVEHGSFQKCAIYDRAAITHKAIKGGGE